METKYLRLSMSSFLNKKTVTRGNGISFNIFNTTNVCSFLFFRLLFNNFCLFLPAKVCKEIPLDFEIRFVVARNKRILFFNISVSHQIALQNSDQSKFLSYQLFNIIFLSCFEFIDLNGRGKSYQPPPPTTSYPRLRPSFGLAIAIKLHNSLSLHLAMLGKPQAPELKIELSLKIFCVIFLGSCFFFLHI